MWRCRKAHFSKQSIGFLVFSSSLPLTHVLVQGKWVGRRRRARRVFVYQQSFKRGEHVKKALVDEGLTTAAAPPTTVRPRRVYTSSKKRATASSMHRAALPNCPGVLFSQPTSTELTHKKYLNVTVKVTVWCLVGRYRVVFLMTRYNY